MVVRLKDLENGTNKRKSGLVRLSDLQPQEPAPAPAPTVHFDVNPIQRTAQLTKPFQPKPALPGMVHIQPQTFHTNTQDVGKLQSAVNFLKQAQKGAQEEVAYDAGKPVPTTGSSTADKVARFIGGSLAGLTTGQTEMQALGAVGRGVESVAAKVAPGLVSRLAGSAAEDAAQGAVGGAMMGQTNPRDVATNAAFGGGLGILGRGIVEGFAAPAHLNKIAKDLTESNPVYRTMLQEVGENGVRADVGKRQLADIDEQINSLRSRDISTPHKKQEFANELEALQNDRNQTISYIKQHEPGFEVPALSAPRAYDVPEPAPNLTPAIKPEAPVKANTGPVRLSEIAPNKVPAQTVPTVPNERGFMTTLRGSENVSPEVKQALETSGERTYRPITNQGTLNKVNKRIAKNIDREEARVLGSTKPTPEHVATGIRLIQELQRGGQTERAVSIAEKLSKHLTEAGQTVQAASIINRLSPEGALLYAQRKVNRINETLPEGQQVKITAKDAEDIQQAAQAAQAAGASKERAGDVMDIAARMKRGEDVTEADKQVVTSFMEDLQSLVKPKQVKEPRPARAPEEMKDTRVRDRVLSTLDAAEQAAKERLRAKGISISSNPLDVWADYAVIGAAKLAKMAVKGTSAFADWSAQMVEEFGDSVKPHLSELFDRAKKIVSGTSKHISAGNIDKAEQIIRKVSGQAAAEKAVVQEMAAQVRKSIEDAKIGKFNIDDMQKIRDLSEKIASFPKKTKMITEDQKYLQKIKSLAKKLADVEEEKIPPSDALREVTDLLRQVSNITKDGVKNTEQLPIDTKAIESLSYQMLERTKPSQAEKIVKSYLRKNEDKLTPKDIEFIHSMAKNVSELKGAEQQAASRDLQEVLNRFERAGIGRKIDALKYVAMLLNPTTQIRNIVGNEIMYRLERVQRLIATPLDIVSSAVSRKPRTITYRSGPMSWENFFSPITDYIKGLSIGSNAGWRGVNPEGLTTAYDIGGLAFQSKLNPVRYLEKTLGAVMKGFDYAAYNRAVNQRLKEMAYLDAINKGIKGRENIQQHIDQYVVNTDENIANIAKEYGKYITLQDDNAVTRAAVGARNVMNLYKSFGVGSIVLPFAKTPANLLLRAMEYSPAGFVKAIYQAAQIMRKANVDLSRADVIQSVTRALLGTGLTGVGIWLADKGVLTGQSSKDKDVRNLEQAAGKSQFQLNASALQRMLGAVTSGSMQDIDNAAKWQTGDQLWSYDWAQPTSMPLAIGANIIQEKTKQQQQEALGKSTHPDRLSQAFNTITGGLSTLYDASFMQGLQQLFQTVPGQDNSVANMAENVLKQVPGMFVPSMFNKLNQSMDETMRETYSPNFTEQLLNPAESKIPGLAQKMPEKIGTLGETRTRSSNPWDVFLNPSQRQEYKPSPEAKFVMDLMNETGNTNLAPRTVDRNITGIDRVTGQSRKAELTGEQVSHYQQLVGQRAARLIDRINPALSTQMKVKRVLDALDKAGKYGKAQMKKELGLR